jgi:hypothetical protein
MVKKEIGKAHNGRWHYANQPNGYDAACGAGKHNIRACFLLLLGAHES